MITRQANRALATTLTKSLTTRAVVHQRGLVTAVQTSPPRVAVALNGGSATIVCRYAKGYTPVVGDVAEVLRSGATKFVIILA